MFATCGINCPGPGRCWAQLNGQLTAFGLISMASALAMSFRPATETPNVLQTNSLISTIDAVTKKKIDELTSKTNAFREHGCELVRPS